MLFRSTATVIDANTFTVTTVASTTTSGNVTLRQNTIRASGNVSSVADNALADFTVNFSTAMPDANYSVAGCGQQNAGASRPDMIIAIRNASDPTTTSVRMGCTNSTGSTETAYLCVSIFR